MNRAKEPGINSFAIHCVCSFWKKYLVTLLTFTLNVSILLNESKSYRWKANRTFMTSPASGRFHVSIIWIVYFLKGLNCWCQKKYIRDGVVNMTLCNWQLKLEIIMSLLCSNTVKKLSKYVVIILLKFHLLPLLIISTFLVHLLLNFDCCWHQIPWFFLDALTNKYR